MTPASQSPLVIRGRNPTEVLGANRAFTEVFGATREELHREPLLEWIHPEDRAEMKRALDSGNGRVSARHRKRSGGWGVLDWQIRTHDDQVVALGRGVARERSLSEGEGDRRTPHATLYETLDTMALIVEAKNPGLRCSILLVDHDRESITVGAGPSFPKAYNEAIEGLRIGPAVGSCGTAAYWNVQVIVDDIHDDPLWSNLREAAALADVGSCWSQPIVGASGNVLGAMALYDRVPNAPTPHQLDGLEIAAHMVGLVVEGARNEEQLRQLAKMEALGVLAGGIAHDFNNLLVAILGNAELALGEELRGESRGQSLRAIVTASLRARELCDQMLTFAGRSTLTKETFECNALMEELGALLQVTLSKKASLQFDLAPEPLGLQADRGQLVQVVMNLITNASEALGNAEGRILISTTARSFLGSERECQQMNQQLPRGDYVCITVEDTGVGMAPATQRRIFDPFFTTKSVGRGLGLAAVQGIVAAHGGAVLIDSDPGRGTIMTVLLPRASMKAPGQGPGVVESTPHRRARILVVDDEPIVLRTLVRILESAGHTVTTSSDGQEALEVFRDRPNDFDCVILDLSMPRLDGVETLEALSLVRPGIRVVLSSGFAEKDILERFNGARPAAVMRKPATKRVLLQTVADVLE